MILETKEENIIIREKDNFEKLCVSFLAHSFFFCLQNDCFQSNCFQIDYIQT